MAWQMTVPKEMTPKQLGDTLFRTMLFTPMAQYIASEFMSDAMAMDEDDERDSAQEAK